ncbi:MAG: DUF4910 domain-containing protein [Rickettsiaceae bacterium]
MLTEGERIYNWCKDLFPICRSLTGGGVRQTLNYLKTLVPELELLSVPSGTKVFDWEVPKEWNIKDAWIKDKKGRKIINFKENNLHILGYSLPIHKKLDLSELEKHLHSIPEQPNAIPYITSYYKERWGFCLAHSQRQSLLEGEYEVFIDSSLKKGLLNYGEILLKGESDKEILLSTYVCHPSMGNNELSGITVTVAIAQWLKSINRKYSYRVVFAPETIGSLIYIEKHLKHLKQKLICGFVISCIGDERGYSFVNTPYGNTLADRVIEHAANLQSKGNFTKYSYLQRGSDERQYCAPNINLPVVTVCRSKFGKYAEYHTSLDDLTVVTPEGLQGGFEYLQKAILILEKNEIYKSTVLGEPHLGKSGLYPNLSTKQSSLLVSNMMNLIAYSNGENDLLKISDICKGDFFKLVEIAKRLQLEKLLCINSEL